MTEEAARTTMVAEAARHLYTPDVLSPEFKALPFSEISHRDRRLDAEVYLSDGYTVRQAISQARLPTYQLGAIADIWQPYRLKGIKVDPEHGVPFLAATQAFDIWPKPRKWLAQSKTPDFFSRLVLPDWILVTCSGTVGNAIITYSAHTEKVISHDLLRLQIQESHLRNYVYAFLRTRFGRAMMRGSHYGNVIKHLEVAHLQEIPIPVIDRLCEGIGDQISRVYEARDEAYQLDMAARQQFADAMVNKPGLLDENGYSTSATKLFGRRRRLEANAYSPESQQVVQAYKQNSLEIETLSESCRTFVPSRFKRIYGNDGMPYLDSEPIFKVNPELSKFLTPATKIDFDAYKVERGWLLMACSGQIYGINGQAIVASEMHEDKVITQHIMRIVPTERIQPGYLQTVLSHPTLGKPLVVSRAYGTSVPELSAEDIGQLPIPRLDERVEDEIAIAAERASELRVQANKTEFEVVMALEAELEEELGV